MALRYRRSTLLGVTLSAGSLRVRASIRSGCGASRRPAARRENGAYGQYSVRHEGAEGQWMRDPPE